MNKNKRILKEIYAHIKHTPLNIQCICDLLKVLDIKN